MTTKEGKALTWFVESRKLKPQLSTPPTYYFMKEDGELVKFEMVHILSLYERSKNES